MKIFLRSQIVNMNVNKIRKQIPWIKNNKNKIYFDNAATTLKPKCVIDKICYYYTNLGTNTHNTDSKFCFEVHKKIETARKDIAKIINCPPKNICFVSGATEGLTMIAHGLAHYYKKAEIILNDFEHASNLLPWYHEKQNGFFTIKFINTSEQFIEKAIIKAITKNTKIIALTLTSNVYGNIIDYLKLCAKIKKINRKIIIVLDTTQYLAHKWINKLKDIDFIVCSAHKLFGPLGIGFVYLKNDWIKKMQPLKYGGGMNETITQKKFQPYNDIQKFEGGTLPLAEIIGWQEAIKFIDKIGIKNIFNYECELKKYFIKKMSQIKNLEIYNPNTPLPIIIFNYKGINAQDFASWLGTKGIICRSGLSCAKLIKNVIKKDSFVRCSLSIYNTKKEIDKLYNVIKSYKKGDEIRKIL